MPKVCTRSTCTTQKGCRKANVHVHATSTVSRDHNKRIGDTPVFVPVAEDDEAGSEFVGELVGAVVVVVVVVVAVGEADAEEVGAAVVMVKGVVSALAGMWDKEEEEAGFSVEFLLLRLVGEVELLSRRSEPFLLL